MKSMTVRKHSVFPAAKGEVFFRLQKPDTLRFIAAPYATFTPTDGKDSLVWEAGRTFSFDLKLFGIAPLGVHTIRVQAFSPNGAYTNEGNYSVPIWNHRIVLEELDATHTGYTDEVEIGAGMPTPYCNAGHIMIPEHGRSLWV